MRRYLILFLIFINACNKNSNIPSQIIKPVQMQNILWDMIRGDILAQEIIKKDSTQTLKSANFIITEKILALHNTDRVKFKKSMAFYEKHPALIKSIFDSLNAIQTRQNPLNIEKKRIGKNLRLSPLKK